MRWNLCGYRSFRASSFPVATSIYQEAIYLTVANQMQGDVDRPLEGLTIGAPGSHSTMQSIL